MKIKHLRNDIMNAVGNGDMIMGDGAPETFDLMVEALSALRHLVDSIGVDSNDEYYITTQPGDNPVVAAEDALEELT